MGWSMGPSWKMSQSTSSADAPAVVTKKGSHDGSCDRARGAARHAAHAVSVSVHGRTAVSAGAVRVAVGVAPRWIWDRRAMCVGAQVCGGASVWARRAATRPQPPRSYRWRAPCVRSQATPPTA
eukprot:360558-Prymnesium_polylepis.1